MHTLKLRYIALAGVLLLGASAFMGELSHREARKQAKAIVAADVAATDTTVLQEKLADYTKSHMQASVSLVLDGSYKRALAAAQAAGAGSAATPALYQQAQAACSQGRVDSVRQAECVSNYVAARATPGKSPQAVAMPTKAQYTKTFMSPLWTPDPTGFAAALGWLALAGSIALGLGKRLFPTRR